MHADPQSEDFFSGDGSSIASDPDDIFFDPKQPDPLFPDLMSDSSLMSMGSSDFARTDPTGSSSSDSPIEASAPDSLPFQSSCQTQSDDLFGAIGLADDEMLQGRDNNAAICADPERSQKIDHNMLLSPYTGQKIPETFRPGKKYPELGVILSDPPGSFIREYGECFLPYMTRCCCYGTYSWGKASVWGPIVEQIDWCSVGTYMFSKNSYMQEDFQMPNFKF